MKNVFGFLEEAPLSGEIAFPTLRGTLFDYWRSDRGVTLSGGAVTTWTGEHAGNNFSAATTGGPTVSGSNADFAGVQTLTFNGTSQGLGNTQTTPINGVNTGSVNMAIYAAPHGDGAHSSNFDAIFGISTDGNTPLITEAVMRASGTSNIQLYGFPPGQTNNSSDNTYGKGLYTITQGDPDGFGQGLSGKFCNKNRVSVAGLSYSSYNNARQPFMIGAYNALNAADLFGKVDVAGCVIWSNSTGLQDDIDDLISYFTQIYG